MLASYFDCEFFAKNNPYNPTYQGWHIRSNWFLRYNRDGTFRVAMGLTDLLIIRPDRVESVYSKYRVVWNGSKSRDFEGTPIGVDSAILFVQGVVGTGVELHGYNGQWEHIGNRI